MTPEQNNDNTSETPLRVFDLSKMSWAENTNAPIPFAIVRQLEGVGLWFSTIIDQSALDHSMGREDVLDSLIKASNRRELFANIAPGDPVVFLGAITDALNEGVYISVEDAVQWTLKRLYPQLP